MQEISLRITVDGSGNLVIDQTTGKIRQMAATSVKASSEMEAAFSRVKGVIATLVSAAAPAMLNLKGIEGMRVMGGVVQLIRQAFYWAGDPRDLFANLAREPAE